MSIRKPNPTQAAGILRKFLQEQGIELPHMAALEAVARIEGHSDWQSMTAAVKKQRELDKAYPPLLRPDPAGEDNSDFIYVDNPGNKGAWVAIGSINVMLKPTDEGVVVDLYALGAEDRESEAGTWLHYQDALNTLCMSLEVEQEDVEAWVRETLGVDFGEQSPTRQSELVRQFYNRPRATAVSNQPRYLHGNWDHIFRGNKAETTRIVFDREQHAIVCMEVREHGRWLAASRDDVADVQDSLLNANDDALGKPQDWGLEESDTLPQWAAAYVQSGQGH